MVCWWWLIGSEERVRAEVDRLVLGDYRRRGTVAGSRVAGRREWEIRNREAAATTGFRFRFAKARQTLGDTREHFRDADGLPGSSVLLVAERFLDCDLLHDDADSTAFSRYALLVLPH